MACDAACELLEIVVLMITSRIAVNIYIFCKLRTQIRDKHMICMCANVCLNVCVKESSCTHFRKATTISKFLNDIDGVGASFFLLCIILRSFFQLRFQSFFHSFFLFIDRFRITSLKFLFSLNRFSNKCCRTSITTQIRLLLDFIFVWFAESIAKSEINNK